MSTLTPHYQIGIIKPLTLGRGDGLDTLMYLTDHNCSIDQLYYRSLCTTTCQSLYTAFQKDYNYNTFMQFMERQKILVVKFFNPQGSIDLQPLREKYGGEAYVGDNAVDMDDVIMIPSDQDTSTVEEMLLNTKPSDLNLSDKDV